MPNGIKLRTNKRRGRADRVEVYGMFYELEVMMDGIALSVLRLIGRLATRVSSMFIYSVPHR